MHRFGWRRTKGYHGKLVATRKVLRYFLRHDYSDDAADGHYHCCCHTSDHYYDLYFMIPGMFVQYMLALSFDSSAISPWFLWFQGWNCRFVQPRVMFAVRTMWRVHIGMKKSIGGRLRAWQPWERLIKSCAAQPLTSLFLLGCLGDDKRLCDKMYETAISNMNRIHSRVRSYNHRASSMNMMVYVGQCDQVVMTFQTLQDWLLYALYPSFQTTIWFQETHFSVSAGVPDFIIPIIFYF